MKYFILVLTACLFLSLSYSAYSQTITTNPLTANEFCAGTSIDVNYNISGTFDPNNVFNLQISNTGFVNFRNIGNIKSSLSGKITTVLPDDLTEATNYRVRVISSNPYIVGSDNGVDFAVYSRNYGSISIKYDKYFHRLTDNVSFSMAYNNLKNFTALWNFGKDANPQTFIGINPPSVRYSSLGVKTITCEVSSSIICSNSSKDSKNISVIGCEEAIDSNAFVDSIVVDYGQSIPQFNNAKQVWILPNGSITVSHIFDLIVIIESGGSLTVNEAYNSEVYLKPGASLFVKFEARNCAIIKTPGSSAIVPDSGGNTVMDCPSIKYHYSAAPAGGIAVLLALGYSDIKEDIQNISTFDISPNPVTDFLHLSGNYSEAPVRIYTPEGIKILETEWKNEIDVSALPVGIYFIRNGTKVSKFVKI